MDVETVRLLLERTFQMPVAESDAQLVLNRLQEIIQAESGSTSVAGDGLHSCLCGERIPLDEYRCSNCRAWETTRA